MSRLVVALCLALAPGAANRSGAADPPLGASRFARAGRSPFVDAERPSVPVWSPDRRAAIVWTDDGVRLTSGRRSFPLKEVLGTPSVSEVVWSATSDAVVINWSDGGAVGQWNASLYLLSKGGPPVYRNTRRLLAPETAGFAQCGGGHELNIAAAAWLRHGRELLVVAQAPGHSSCRNMGAVRGFRISVTAWKVLERMSSHSLTTRWRANLGPELAEAATR